MQFRVAFSAFSNRLLVVRPAVAAQYWKLLEIEGQRVTALDEPVRYAGVQHGRHVKRMIRQNEVWRDLADSLLGLSIDLAFERIGGDQFLSVRHPIERTHRQCLLEPGDYVAHSLCARLFVHFKYAELEPRISSLQFALPFIVRNKEDLQAVRMTIQQERSQRGTNVLEKVKGVKISWFFPFLVILVESFA